VSVAVFLVWGPRHSPIHAAADPKTIVDLQRFRQITSIKIRGAQGEEGLATLINLNPTINAWYLLRLERGGDRTRDEYYHLQNAYPEAQRLSLEKSHPDGLLVTQGKDESNCDLWGTMPSDGLKTAKASHLPYTPLCNGKLYLRNPTRGHQSPVEAVTDFLRKEVPGGERIVATVRDTFFTYIYQYKAGQKVESEPATDELQKKRSDGPAPCLIDPKQADRVVKPTDLGIETEGSGPDGMVPGGWYGARGNPGIFVSVTVPDWIAPEIMQSYPKVVAPLDSGESAQLVYLVAFDLGHFDLHYALGTIHPEVGWAGHILPQMRDRSLPGPDGIGSSAPLVRTGLINPTDVPLAVAAFTGGYKRYHGAFKYGPLSLKNHGSHYGFLTDGVLFSTLQPDLATLYVLNDGRADMKTWTDEDNLLLPRVSYARQNGVPIIAGFDQVTQMSVPGQFVNRWGPGNWSGSADENLRTMRAGVGLQALKGRRFLIYAFFWSATPSAMARIFQAYQCRYAMLLDMNALVHTYLAVYRRQGSSIYVQHLIKGMSGEDMSVKGRPIPRFLAYADDRDFFYLTRKEAP
jgi:hypothetical protein